MRRRHWPVAVAVLAASSDPGCATAGRPCSRRRCPLPRRRRCCSWCSRSCGGPPTGRPRPQSGRRRLLPALPPFLVLIAGIAAGVPLTAAAVAGRRVRAALRAARRAPAVHRRPRSARLVTPGLAAGRRRRGVRDRGGADRDADRAAAAVGGPPAVRPSSGVQAPGRSAGPGEPAEPGLGVAGRRAAAAADRAQHRSGQPPARRPRCLRRPLVGQHRFLRRRRPDVARPRRAPRCHDAGGHDRGDPRPAARPVAAGSGPAPRGRRRYGAGRSRHRRARRLRARGTPRALLHGGVGGG
jgi:hypothetical protein